ncbi:MAG: hypothetical protein EAZ08_01495 [Cytophagales bacterium]|nr:MAG: hypothetical protein EAZ08_01495 [Cytophagales bacterium]
MSFSEFVDRVSRFDQLIRQGRTGNYQKTADRLEISKSTLYELIERMKDMGAPVAYCPIRQSYIYTEEGRIEIGFKKANKSAPPPAKH